MADKKERIWEIDALRGFFLIFVFVSHFSYDLTLFFDITIPDIPVIYYVFHYGGSLFILISGLSATLGSKSFRRGVTVFGCGLGITAVTVILYELSFFGSEDLIQFGILHLIGFCMMLYPLLKKLPDLYLLLLSLAVFVIGILFENITLHASETALFDIRNYLFPFGLLTDNFAAADYFPIFPNLSYFLLGIVLGRTLYKDKTSRLPNFPKDFPLVRAIRFMGRHSLIFYLAHQPLLFGVLWLVSKI